MYVLYCSLWEGLLQYVVCVIGSRGSFETGLMSYVEYVRGEYFVYQGGLRNDGC